jgi:hypothetical protein
MDSRDAGLLVAALGVVVVIAGLAIAFGLLGWFGRLPGDIRIGGDNVRVLVPVTSMILVSLVLTLALAFGRRLF